MSEARAARWLVGDDLRLQGDIDRRRTALTAAGEELGGARQNVHVFAALAGSYQRVFAFDPCTNVGSRPGGLERVRLGAAVGVTHDSTELHARLSFMQSADYLTAAGILPADADEDDSPNSARAGTVQTLFAARLGHERYLQGLLGYITADSSFSTRGDGVQLRSRPPALPTPGVFFGFTSPLLRTSLVTLLQRGRPEVVSLLATELRLGTLPFSVTLGPTYLREERQIVQLARIRGYSYEGGHGPRRASGYGDEGGYATQYDVAGPVLEASVETGSARLRHARFRWEYNHSYRLGGATHGNRATADFGIHGEGTVFRSRFFVEPVGQPARGNAWGCGAALHGALQIGWIGMAGDLVGAYNRPELLALVPSAAGRAELQVALALSAQF